MHEMVRNVYPIDSLRKLLTVCNINTHTHYGIMCYTNTLENWLSHNLVKI
jgi:hypothetical protein